MPVEMAGTIIRGPREAWACNQAAASRSADANVADRAVGRTVRVADTGRGDVPLGQPNPPEVGPAPWAFYYGRLDDLVPPNGRQRCHVPVSDVCCKHCA